MVFADLFGSQATGRSDIDIDIDVAVYVEDHFVTVSVPHLRVRAAAEEAV